MATAEDLYNLASEAKRKAWDIYYQISNFYIRKLRKGFEEKRDWKSSQALTRNIFHQMLIATYKSNPAAFSTMLRDPRIQNYFRMEAEDVVNELVSTLQKEGADNKMIAAIVPEHRLNEYDIQHGTHLSEIKDLGEFTTLKQEKLDSEFEAYQAYLDHTYNTSKKSINSSDTPSKKRKFDQSEIQPSPPSQSVPDISDSISSIEQSQIEDPFDQNITEEPAMPSDMEISVEKSGGGTGLGHHGSYFGTAQRHPGFEKSRLEREVVKTHNRRDEIVYWGMSTFQTDYDSKPPWGADLLLTGTQKTGVIRVSTDFLNAQLLYPYNATVTTSFSNQVYCVPLNFTVRDFFDHKTLNQLTGRLRDFEKISLAEIHVEVEIHTKKGSAFENEWYLSQWQNLQGVKIENLRAAKKDLTWKPQYLVYRDADGEFSTSSSNIGVNTEYATNNVEQKPSRKIQSVRKKDRTTDIVSHGFSFTRKVTSGGPYYLTADKIFALRDTNIAALINEIEGQSADASGNLVKWPEFFNFLVGPLNSDFVMAPVVENNVFTTAFLTPNFHTEFHIKTSATWLCMQNAKVSGTIGRKMDPYYQANAQLNMEIAQSFNTH